MSALGIETVQKRKHGGGERGRHGDGLLPEGGAVGKHLDAYAGALRFRPPLPIFGAMYDEPYLETCCRSALHRLTLVGPEGRPPGLKDGPCLARLTGMGLAEERADGRYQITPDGRARHASEILKRPAA
jgi:hypothetical protein